MSDMLVCDSVRKANQEETGLMETLFGLYLTAVS
jgi:hypothetical protein